MSGVKINTSGPATILGQPRDTLAGFALLAALITAFPWSISWQLELAILTTLMVTLSFLCTDPAKLAQALTPTRHLSFILIATLILFIIWLALRSLTSDIPARSIATLSSYTLPILIALRFAHGDINIPKTLTPIHLGIVFLAAWSVLCAALPPLHFWLGSFKRAQWPFEDANHLAMILNVGLFLSLWRYNLATPQHRAFLMIAAGLCFAGVIASGSRGGLLSLFIGMGVYTALNQPKTLSLHKRHIVPALGVVIICSIAAYLFPMGLVGITGFADLSGNLNDALGSRPALWASTLNLIQAKFFFGFGTGTFAAVSPQAMLPRFTSAGYSAHNDTLQFILETGIIGGALYLAIPLLAFCLIWRARHYLDPLMITSAAILTTLFIHAQIEFMIGVLPVLILSGLFLGIILRASRPQTPNKVTKTPWYAAHFLVLLATSIAVASGAGLYAERTLSQAERDLRLGHIENFAKNLHRARAFSFDLHAVPYARAADYRLALMLTSPLGHGPSAQDIQEQLDAARTRDPYLSAIYEIQGRLDEARGQSPLPAWEQGLKIEPRSAGLRLAILQHHAKLGHKREMAAIIQESRAWLSLRGPVETLRNAMDHYDSKGKNPSAPSP